VKTRPFTSTIVPAVINTQHEHGFAATTTDAAVSYYPRKTYWKKSNGDLVQVLMMVADESNSFTFSTGVESTEDFLTVDYGIYNDTETPDTLSIWIDGTNYTSALGGPWAEGGGNETVDLDITEQILSTTLLGEHTVEIHCASGQGSVEFTVEIYNTIQALAI
jgi:hypothetical protein